MKKKLTVIALLLASVTAHAAQLDRIGQTYQIGEPDMLKMIEQKLKRMGRTGELARLQKREIERIKQHIEHPDPVKGLTRVTKPEHFYFDPTYIVPENVKAPDGRILAPAGTRVNPLDYVNMSSYLLFFDGRDPDQLNKAVQVLSHYRGRVKLVLTGGSYMELMRKWKIRVYYDQRGALVRKLGIRHVPSLVSQEGKRLRIDELPL